MSYKHRQSKRTFRRKRPDSAKRRLKIYAPKLLSIALMAGLIIMGCWVWQKVHDPNTLPFHQVRIVGQFHHLQTDELHKKVQIQVKGGFFSLDMPKIKQSLVELPWVEDVSIRRLPGVLIVNVQEQKPIARWNESYLINSKNQIFLAPEDAPAGLPNLQGPEENLSQVLGNYLRINSLLRPLELQVSLLQLDARHSWELTLSNGIKVTVGREDILPRIQRLVRWYPQIIGEKAGEVVHIDLRYQNNLAVEWKK